MKKTIQVAVIALAVVTASPAFAMVSPAYAAGPTVVRASQGYLGVDLRDVSDEQVSALKLKEAHGAEIVHIDHDGPAAKAGLRERDVILQMNGTVIEGEEQLRRMLRETPAGRTVSFVISRDGQQQTLSAQLANRAEVEKKAWDERAVIVVPEAKSESYSYGNNFVGSEGAKIAPKGASHSFMGTTILLGSGYTGAVLDSMEPQLAEYFGVKADRGLLVRSVDANSPASAAGMHAGDVVVRVNQREVASRADWLKAVRENKGKPVTVVVLRDRHEQTLTMTPDSKKRSSAEPQVFFFNKEDMADADVMMAEIQPEMAKALAEAQKEFEALRASGALDKELLAAKEQASRDTEKFLKSPEFKLEMENARKQLDAPEFKKEIEELKKQIQEFAIQFDDN